MAKRRSNYARRGQYGRKGRGAARAGERDGRPSSYAPRASGNPAVIVFAVTAMLIVGLGALIFVGGGTTPTGLSTDGGGEPAPAGTICGLCKGSGRFDCQRCDRPGTSCSACEGYGYLECGSCSGTGR